MREATSKSSSPLAKTSALKIITLFLTALCPKATHPLPSCHGSASWKITFPPCMFKAKSLQSQPCRKPAFFKNQQQAHQQQAHQQQAHQQQAKYRPHCPKLTVPAP